MSLESGEFSLRRARFLTLLVLVIVGIGIALANLSSQPVTIDVINDTIFKGKPAERVFGWPLIWCRQSRGPASAPRWPVSRYSASRLCANLSIWLAMLVAASAVCEWLLRLYRPRLRWRPRLTTLIVLTIVSALTVLANLSYDASPGPTNWEEFLYGWPLIWYRRINWSSIPSAFYEEWDYSAAALGGNLVVWLLILVVTALSWERLMRRYRPPFRFSLRVMLLVVLLTGAFCAFWIKARNRSAGQEAVVRWLHPNDEQSAGEWFDADDLIYVERRRPKWLDVVGAEPFCRYIVGIRVNVSTLDDDPKENGESFKRLAHLSSLRFLDIEPDCHPRAAREFTPDMAAILGEMRQLEMLNLECRSGFRKSASKAAHEYLAAIGKLVRLERLRLGIWTDSSPDLSELCSLTNLRTLALNVHTFNYRSDESDQERAADGRAAVLGHLPMLPRLEGLDVHDTPVGDEDLGRLAGFARLKWIDLCGTSVTDAGLAKLAPLASLEELAIDERIATAVGFDSLARFRHLAKLHIATSQDRAHDSAPLELDDGGALAAPAAEVDGIRRALRTLRQQHEGIAIDAKYDEFHTRGDLEPPWFDGDRQKMHAFMQRWLYHP